MRTLRTKALVIGALAAAAIAAAGTAPAATWKIVAEAEGNLVKFESSATLESFEGKTSNVWGRVTLDPAALGSHLEIEVEVDLRSLDTGIELRNRHMRENHLETERFPTARFEGADIVEGAGSSLAPGATVAIVVEGNFDLHGVTKTVRIPLELTHDGTNLRIAGRFPVALSDHEIARPKFLIMRLGDVQQVTVDVTAVPEG
jgi:polyisoprenoid-binding protein YceI